MNELLPDPYFYQQLPSIHASGSVILRDEHGRFVIEKPNYRDHWLLPGGGVDGGEDARIAAEREVLEEIGLTVTAGRMLVANWVPSHIAQGSTMGVHFIFDAGVMPAAELEATIRLQESELDDWRLIDREDAHLLSDWGGRRTLYALDVLDGKAEPAFIGQDGRGY
ncbi:NUDIX hydrolase [Helcobacillus massiliensis]|uniref:NUDIX domain-containing protein n=1 Tax=Helcobacillus massiliensis TaxID=521392 RepID=UPI0021A8E989|nr:NUDIX hydrolase [Helcobacillus massiliensis]MCT1557592.1 NUDIX hydrolase [Helcobacillus massiliensis]MCT2037156.1 NUDIX hydrolase [Helcobacillus massiliensis]MCT2332430.1 NUDIX hydrolase [Helcobacillus massiliensis]